MEIAAIQELLRRQGVPAWLLYDFRHSNPIAYRTLGLDERRIATRRWYYLIPAEGEPAKLVSPLEAGILDPLPGERTIYRTWQEREAGLRKLLTGLDRVAMEYSPRGMVPYISLVDGGTLELIRSFGVEVVSSADLVQETVARWDAAAVESHRTASEKLMAILDEAYAEVRRCLRAAEPLTDYGLQQYMWRRYQEAGLVSEAPPIVATNAHASDPHYQPNEQHQTRINEGDVLLIDFWAKLDRPRAMYADHTWMAFVGARVPEEPAKVFTVVAEARDAAIDLVREAARTGRQLQGWQVDAAARQVIKEAGYADYFVHRTGHNIGEETHGEGANMDDFETHDVRAVLPNTCFSVEPGIYLPSFGVRSEVDVYYAPPEVVVTGGPQREMIALLA
jgi:Xaa-Pro aminopeptidase